MSAPGLFWRVFALNAGLLVLATVLLAVTPATVSDPITREQAILLTVAGTVALLANALLIRLSLRPLRELVRLTDDVDLLRPGQRLTVGGAREMVLLTRAFNDMLSRLESERRTSSSESLDSQELERRRIATELHDELGQGLTALLLRLRGALAEAPSTLAPTLSSALEITREMLDEVGRITRQLRPTVLDDLGLESALRVLCDAVARSTDVAIVQEYEPDLPLLGEDIELALYRIAQEALTNVARHADASLISLALRRQDGGLELSISDDGRGMIHAAKAESGGVRGIRERALAAGGRVTIDSHPGCGTNVIVNVPVNGGKRRPAG